MPCATNPIDGVRSSFGGWHGDGPPILVYDGLGHLIDDSREMPFVHARSRSAPRGVRP